MVQLFTRELEIRPVANPITGSSAVFLWGPRQTGKTTLVKRRFPGAAFYDLLDSDQSARLSVRPGLLREEVLGQRPERVVIDEVQKVPGLLDEVHWLLENSATAFILCGSSARKLRRKARNLLGGRAVEQRLLPLCSREVPGLDLDRMLNHGGLPAHYLSDSPQELLSSYVNTYIKEEIIDESLTRNIPAFSRFLQVAGLTHGRQLNYANVGRESGVSAGTVRNYYQILKDTLLGFELEPWRVRKKRRLVETSRFFLFDIGVANHLNPEGHTVVPGSDTYGRAFEHFLLNEVRAYLEYRRSDAPLCYWRTSSGVEVDLIAAEMDLALEFKSTVDARPADLRGLRALKEEHAVGRAVLVSRDERARRSEDGIEMMHWTDFCTRLWAKEIL
jgi:predicted AAA+ superfamily ATPase